jgi:hypothetical protein
MPSISIPAAVAGAGAIGAVGSVASAGIGASAAQSAAQLQASAADTASQNTLNEFNQTQQNLSPFVKAGQQGIGELQSALPGLTTGLMNPLFAPTQANLASTPGYQFSLQQGQLGVQNSFAAQGLGQSGAALKGAANYAEGLAGTTFGQQAQNYYSGVNAQLAQNQQIFSQLGGLSTIGENAAAMTGTQGLTATGQAGNFLTSGAAASAAGTVGAANAITGGISSATGGINNTALALSLNNSGLFGGSGSSIGGSDAAQDLLQDNGLI